jgi:hypothetical protein
LKHDSIFRIIQIQIPIWKIFNIFLTHIRTDLQMFHRNTHYIFLLSNQSRVNFLTSSTVYNEGLEIHLQAQVFKTSKDFTTLDR